MILSERFHRVKERISRVSVSFHNDEEGLNIIEIILIIFIAVVILVALAAFFKESVWSRVKDTINGLMGTSF